MISRHQQTPGHCHVNVRTADILSPVRLNMKITIMATIQDKSDPSPEEFDKMTRSRVWVVLVNILQILNNVQVDC